VKKNKCFLSLRPTELVDVNHSFLPPSFIHIRHLGGEQMDQYKVGSAALSLHFIAQKLLRDRPTDWLQK
jgi:hypothetical protein